MENTAAMSRKLELLNFIGINAGLIGDLVKLISLKNPDIETLSELLTLYQENEEYRNELEGIMNKEYHDLTWELIELKQRGGNL